MLLFKLCNLKRPLTFYLCFYFPFFRSTGKSEFRRNEVPSNVGLPASIPSLASGGGSVITPNGSGRATPVANGGVPVVEEFPPDIQYYVDFASITDPSSLTPTKTAVLSPVIPGVPGAAIVPTPAYALSAPPPAATSSEYSLQLLAIYFCLFFHIFYPTSTHLCHLFPSCPFSFLLWMIFSSCCCRYCCYFSFDFLSPFFNLISSPHLFFFFL